MASSITSICPLIIIKTLHRHSYTKIVHHFTVLWVYIYPYINFKMQYIKYLSEITPEVGATAERGARFHPTIGVATPDGFTTSHPRADTTMLLRLRLTVYQWPGAKIAILPLCYHSLCIMPEFPSCVPPRNPFWHMPYPLARLHVARLPSRRSCLTAL